MLGGINIYQHTINIRYAKNVKIESKIIKNLNKKLHKIQQRFEFLYTNQQTTILKALVKGANIEFSLQATLKNTRNILLFMRRKNNKYWTYTDL